MWNVDSKVIQIKQDDFGSSSAVHMVHNISILYLLMPETGKSNTVELFHCVHTTLDI